MAEEGKGVHQKTNEYDESLVRIVNISKLVKQYHHLRQLVWPFVTIFHNLVLIVSWDSPKKTIQVWLASLVLCLSAHKYYLLLLLLALLIVVAVLGWLCHLNSTLVEDHHSQYSNHTHPSKVIPDAIFDSAAKRDTEVERKKKTVLDCRLMIQDLSKFLDDSCKFLEVFYSLLSWSNICQSLIFYLSVAITILSSFLMPLNLSLSILVCLIFGANPGFLRVLQSSEISQNPAEVGADEPAPPQKPKLVTVQIDSVSVSNLDNNVAEAELSGTESDKGENHTPVKNNTSSSSVEEHKAVAEKNQDESQKIPEKGECFSCLASFNSFRKRRRYCRSCGNHFCPKCCSKKLPRSALGATSPAAKVEKELVCNDCCRMLTNESHNPNLPSS